MLMPKTLENHLWKVRKAFNVLVVLTEWIPMELSRVQMEPKSTPTCAIPKESKHLSCSHRQGQFVAKKRINNQTVHVHTGTIDNVWKMIKKSLPTSLTTKDSKKPSCLNRKIWQHVRAWQWRWENSTSHNLSHLTASTLMKSKGVKKKTGRRLGFGIIGLKNGRPKVKEKNLLEMTQNDANIMVFVGRNGRAKEELPIETWVRKTTRRVYANGRYHETSSWGLWTNQSLGGNILQVCDDLWFAVWWCLVYVSYCVVLYHCVQTYRSCNIIAWSVLATCGCLKNQYWCVCCNCCSKVCRVRYQYLIELKFDPPQPQTYMYILYRQKQLQYLTSQYRAIS